MVEALKTTNFDQAVAFLMSLVRDDPRPYQAREHFAELPIRALLARLGDPHAALPVVHIAGSKGKGSTALYLEAILNEAGLRTGTFTSPHLQRWTERYRVDGRESTPEEFAALMARLQPHVRDLQCEDETCAPSFFDVLAAGAFLMFAERNVDCAIIEAGIGGRLDATNVVQPRLCCITSVELEHTDKLGASIAAIAGEKAGIIKQGVPVIIGELPPEAESLIRERAARLGARVDVPAPDSVPNGTLPSTVSACNARNAALAVACARGFDGLQGLDQAVARALAGTCLPGRMEIVGERPWVVIDGAHTPDSTRALAEMLATLPARRKHLVVSLSADRDAASLLAPLLDGASTVVVTSADATRSLDSRRVAQRLVADGFDASRVQTIPDPRVAVRKSHEALEREDLLCVAGSMYMAGVARETLLGGRR